MTSKERTTAKITYAKKNRFLALNVVLAIMGAVDAVILLGTQNNDTIRQIFTRDSKFALNSWWLQHGEAWRLITGSIGNASAPTMAINLAAVWWLGRQVVPQLTHLKFIAVTLSAIGAGALATLLIDPNGFNYSGMALSGGMAASYVVLRKRNLVGRLQAPQFAQYGYIGLFLAWTLLSTLTSEIGGGYGLVAGAVMAAAVSWWLTDPIRRTQSTPRYALLGCALGAALVIGAGASAQITKAAEPARVPAILEALGGSDLAPDDALDLLQGEMDRLEAPDDGEWISVISWEERGDLGDYQNYHLQCDPEPKVVSNPVYVENRYAKSMCDWLDANRDVLAMNSTIDPSNVTSLVWRIEISGTFRGKPIAGGIYEGGESVTTDPVAEKVHDALAP